MGDILDYPHGPNIITAVLVSERERQESLQSRCDDRSRGQSHMIARKRSQMCRWPLEAGNRSSSRAPRRIADLLTPLLAPYDLVHTYHLHGCPIIKVCSFKPLNLCNSLQQKRKLIHLVTEKQYSSELRLWGQKDSSSYHSSITFYHVTLGVLINLSKPLFSHL